MAFNHLKQSLNYILLSKSSDISKSSIPVSGIIGIFLHNRDHISVSWVSSRVPERPQWRIWTVWCMAFNYLKQLPENILLSKSYDISKSSMPKSLGILGIFLHNRDRIRGCLTGCLTESQSAPNDAYGTYDAWHSIIWNNHRKILYWAKVMTFQSRVCPNLGMYSAYSCIIVTAFVGV